MSIDAVFPLRNFKTVYLFNKSIFRKIFDTVLFLSLLMRMIKGVLSCCHYSKAGEMGNRQKWLHSRAGNKLTSKF